MCHFVCGRRQACRPLFFVPSCKESFHGQHPTALRGQAEREAFFRRLRRNIKSVWGPSASSLSQSCRRSGLPEHPTPTQVEGALAREGEALLAKLPKSAKVIALCVEGVQLSSPALAAQMEQWMVEGASLSPSSLAGPSACTPQ